MKMIANQIQKLATDLLLNTTVPFVIKINSNITNEQIDRIIAEFKNPKNWNKPVLLFGEDVKIEQIKQSVFCQMAYAELMVAQEYLNTETLMVKTGLVFEPVVFEDILDTFERYIAFLKNWHFETGILELQRAYVFLQLEANEIRKQREDQQTIVQRDTSI